MPYGNTSELPERVRNNLPEHAQHIYMEAYNNAEKQYRDPSKRTRGGTLEEVCNRVAWAAVKREYKKQGDKWVRKG